MACKFLKESIRPGTSLSLVYHICFTDHHHYGHLSHEDTVAKYKGTVLGEFLDFEKMSTLIEDAKKAAEEAERQREIVRNTPMKSVSMEYVMRQLCGDELYKRMQDGFNFR